MSSSGKKPLGMVAKSHQVAASVANAMPMTMRRCLSARSSVRE